jgi:hypothetical protein
MNRDTISEDDFDEFEKTLFRVVEKASSLEELSTWLKSQKYVVSTKLQDYLIKTNPPLKEFNVDFKMNDGSIQSKVIDVFILGVHTYKLKGLHDI